MPNSIMLMGIGQALHGIVDPIMLIPSLPEMIDAALTVYPD
jgi:hypothetical protein